MESSLSLRDRLLFYPFLSSLVMHTPLSVQYLNSVQHRRKQRVHSVAMGHFLAYIPSWRKMWPRLVRVGWCTPTTCHYIYHHAQSCGIPYAPAERAGTLHLLLLYPYVLCGRKLTIWLMICPYMLYVFICLCTVNHRIHAINNHGLKVASLVRSHSASKVLVACCDSTSRPPKENCSVVLILLQPICLHTNFCTLYTNNTKY